MDMARSISMPVNFLLGREFLDRSKWRIRFRCQMRVCSVNVVQPDENVRILDEPAALGEPEGKTVLTNQQFGCGYEWLKSLVSQGMAALNGTKRK